MPTAEEVLLYAFAYYDFGNDPDMYPFEMRLVNWEKARTIKLRKQRFSRDDENNLLFRVGFSPERVLPLVDPAIRPIVHRLLDLNALTLASCSGHPRDRHMPAYLCMAFPTKEMGKRFAAGCTRRFEPGEFFIEGRRTELGLGGTFQVTLPVGTSLAYRLPVSFISRALNMRGRRRFWHVISEVIDEFDHKGSCVPPHKLFRERGQPRHKDLYFETLNWLFCTGYEHGGEL